MACRPPAPSSQRVPGWRLRALPRRPSQLPPDIGLERAPLETGDGGDGVQSLGTVLLAALVGVAGVAAAVRGHGGQTRVLAGVAMIVDERPGAVERRWSEVVPVPAHAIAGRVAYGAIDAFDGGVGGQARGRGRLDALDGVAA